MQVLPLNIVGVFLFSKIRQNVSIEWRMPYFSPQMFSVDLTTSERFLLKQLLNSDGNSLSDSRYKSVPHPGGITASEKLKARSIVGEILIVRPDSSVAPP